MNRSDFVVSCMKEKHMKLSLFDLDLTLLMHLKSFNLNRYNSFDEWLR